MDPEKNDPTVTTAGKLRAITAHARAVDAVKLFLYIPGQRGPVECYIAAWNLKPASEGAPNSLNLYAKPVPDPDGTDPPEPIPAPLPADAPDDKGAAGRITERVPNKEDLVTQ